MSEIQKLDDAVCFVCNADVADANTTPSPTLTSRQWRSDLPHVLEQLLGNTVMIVVDQDDVVCGRCSLLLTNCDKLGTDLNMVKQSLKELLNVKYNLKGADVSDFKAATRHGQNVHVTKNVSSEKVKQVRARIPSQKIMTEDASNCVEYINSGNLGLEPCEADEYGPTMPITLFKCKYCKYTTRERPSLIQHLKSHSKQIIFKCSKCDRKFTSRGEIERHIIYVHRSSAVVPKAVNLCRQQTPASKTFTCAYCCTTFYTTRDLTLHEVVCKCNVSNVDVCEMPIYNELQEDDGTFHVDTFVDEQQSGSMPSEDGMLSMTVVAGDEECDYDVVEKMLGQLHNGVLQEDDELPLDVSVEHIEITGSEMSSVALLTQLHEDVMRDENEISVGEYVTTYGSTVEAEDDVVAAQASPVKIQPKGVEIRKLRVLTCARCGLRSTSSVHMKRHVKSHDAINKRTYTCHVCRKVLTTRSNLRRHVGNHDMVPVACAVCKKQFADRLHRKQHMEQAHPQRFACVACDRMFATQQLLRNHEVTHKAVHYKCDAAECDQVFATEIQLCNHRYSKHGSRDQSSLDGRFKCHVCRKIFVSFNSLRRHVLTHEKSTGAVKCNVCSEQASDRLGLRQHVEETHPGTFQCMFCAQTFDNKKSRSSHELSHPERLFHKCEVCLEEFPNLRMLKKHKDTSHREPHCRICRKEITNMSKLIEHEKRHVKYKLKFTCGVCDRQFITPSGLKFHMSVHTGVYNYTCDVCRKGFHSASVLAEHMATHTKEARYTCERCGRCFSSGSTYRIHRIWHDNPFPYKCGVCERKFKHSSMLAVHKRRVHTGERPYKCPYCAFTFSVSSSLKKHVILHTRNYPFKCTHCDKGYTTRTKVARHLARAHEDFSVQNEPPRQCEYKMVLKPEEQPEQPGQDECGEQEEQIHFVTLEAGGSAEHAIYAIFESPPLCHDRLK